MPIILLAVIFGLSNDYEVFVVSRIKDERDGGADPVEAVRDGTRIGVQGVSAASPIMFFVFVSFRLARDVTVRVIGFGTAVGVLLDALSCA